MSDLDVSDLLTLAQAQAVIDAVPADLRRERVPLMEAHGRRLAEDLAVDRDAPPFNKSQMDGYAVRCADVAGAPVRLLVVGEIAAGSSADRPLAPGEAMAIMTGAPVPAGADGVVPVEMTQREGENVVIRESAKAGRYIAPRGNDALAGQIVLKKGTVMESAQLAVAASLGAAQVWTYARPSVAVLSTGDELVQIDQTPGDNQIRNSNNSMLVAMLNRLRCDVRDLGTARDAPAEIRHAMEEGLAADVLIVTGGMSMGTHDYVPQLIRDMGFEMKVTKLRIKPGKPFVFAMKSETCDPSAPATHRYIFGLPGNPVSGFVGMLRLTSRLLARLAGGEIHERWLAGRLDAGLPGNGPREFYQPVIWTPPSEGGTSSRNEFAAVTPLPWKGSADIYTLAAANALLVRSENEPPMAKGTLIRVLEI